MSPTIQKIEQEKISYVNGMKKYLETLKRMSRTEIQTHSKNVLTESNIMDKELNYISHPHKR